MFFRKNEEMEVEELGIENEVIEYCANLSPSEWTLLQKRIEIWQRHERAVERADRALNRELLALEPKQKASKAETGDEKADELDEAIAELEKE